jgi:hypothetical protein
MMTIGPITSRAVLAFAALLGFSFGACADQDSRGQRQPRLPKYTQECASCHIAYPPGMLPASSWQRLMTGLPRHFGADASLDATSVKELSTWLAANAGTGNRVREAPPEDRITRSAWFTREHDEVPAAAWKHPTVKSPSNCSACHAQADQGDFNERHVRIPR